MAIEIGRIKVVSGGWVGGPGLSQLYFTGATHGTVSNTDCVNAAAAVRAFYVAIEGMYPPAWTADVQGIVQILEATTGALIREESITAPAQCVGQGTGGFGSTASGMVASWHTGAVFGRRLLRGRTFLTPMTPAVYETTGQIKSSQAGIVATAANTLAHLATSVMVVWHRPTPGGSNGGYGTMLGATVSVVEAVLRSRRD